jgi:branched-chain amino acid transport system permease protein
VDDLIQVSVSGLSQGAIYGLMALGLTVIFRSTTVLNFAHGESFVLGAFLTLAALDHAIPYPLAVACALVAVFGVGLAINRVAFQPLLESEHTTQVFATVAISFIIKGVIRYFSVDQRGMPPLLGGGPVRLAGAVLNPQHLLTAGTLVLVTAVFGFIFLRTRLGRILRASTQNLRGAKLVGINVKRVFAIMWGVGLAVGAIAGILAAPTLLVSPDVGGRPLLLGFAAMALGGFGSFPGAILGGVAIGLFEAFGGFYVSTTLGDLAGFMAILAVLLFRPQGIFGSSEVA